MEDYIQIKFITHTNGLTAGDIGSYKYLEGTDGEGHTAKRKYRIILPLQRLSFFIARNRVIREIRMQRSYTYNKRYDS